MSGREKTLWRERDGGQKLSIIMFGVCMVLATGLMMFTGIRMAADGDWSALIAPAGFVLILGSLGMAWRRRNAR